MGQWVYVDGGDSGQGCGCLILLAIAFLIWMRGC